MNAVITMSRTLRTFIASERGLPSFDAELEEGCGADPAGILSMPIERLGREALGVFSPDKFSILCIEAP